MDIQKEMIANTLSCGKKKTVLFCEADVIVPDTKPDAEKIVMHDADVMLNGFEVQNGRVLVYGTSKFNILYYSPEGEVKNVKTEAPFTDVIEISGAEPSFSADVVARLQKSECRILNGRKLSVKANVEVSAEVLKDDETEAVSEISGEAVEQQTKKVSYVKKNPMDVQMFLVKENTELSEDMPSVFEILKAEGRISNKNLKVISNKVILKADLDVSVLYTDAENHDICLATVSLPFTEISEIDGINEDWFLLNDMSVVYTNCEVSEDINGNARVLELETAIESRSETMVPYSVDALSDCYGIEMKAETVSGITKLLRHKGDIKFQTGLKSQIQSEQGIERILSINANAKPEGIEKGEKELWVKGKTDVKLLYITENGKMNCIEKEVPFKESLKNVPESCDEAELIVQINGLSYTINGENSVEVRGNLEFSGFLTQSENEMFITAVALNEKETAQKPVSLTVYFVQSGEALWDIAKRYETSVNLICEANGIKPSDSLSGKKLIIPKYRKS